MIRNAIPLLFGISIACVSCSDSSSRSENEMSGYPDVIRNPSGISKMTARLDQSPSRLPPVEEFRVANKHFASIIGTLSSAKRDKDPYKWEGFGRLEILDKRGIKTVIYLYLVGPPPDSKIAFKCEGHSEYYRGGDASALEKAIRAAKADSGK